MSGKARKTQQQIEDGAAILAGIVALTDAIAAGKIDREAERARLFRSRVATIRRHGHARDTDARWEEPLSEIDTILGAYGETTTAYSMGAYLGEIERACLAWQDVSDVIHGKG